MNNRCGHCPACGQEEKPKPESRESRLLFDRLVTLFFIAYALLYIGFTSYRSAKDYEEIRHAGYEDGYRIANEERDSVTP